MKSFTSNVTSEKPVPTVHNRNSTEVKRNVVNRTNNNASNFSDTDRLSKELISAIEKENITEVRRLIDEGADVHAQADSYNTTPLYIAVFVGSKETVEFLITKGANVNIKSDPYGISPLHIASREGHTTIVELLINKGADVNAKFNVKTECSMPSIRHNATPLHYAAEQGHTDTVTLLIARGANVTATDVLNKTPFDYASERNHTEIVALLTAQREAKMCKAPAVEEDPTISPYKTIYLAMQQIIGAIWIICADARQTLAAFIQDTVDMFSLAKEENAVLQNNSERPCEKEENPRKSTTRSSSLSYHGSFVESEKGKKEKNTALQK